MSQVLGESDTEHAVEPICDDDSAFANPVTSLPPCTLIAAMTI